MVILSLKVVLRAGLEPTTLCLEGRCSIQLSYRSTYAVLLAIFLMCLWRPQKRHRQMPLSLLEKQTP